VKDDASSYALVWRMTRENLSAYDGSRFEEFDDDVEDIAVVNKVITRCKLNCSSETCFEIINLSRLRTSLLAVYDDDDKSFLVFLGERKNIRSFTIGYRAAYFKRLDSKTINMDLMELRKDEAFWHCLSS
jgi:hypothetical protein